MDDFIELPHPMDIYALTTKALNIYDAPRLGSKMIGVVPDVTRVPVVGFKISHEAGKIYMSIGGYPEQWITAYHNGQMNVRYLTGE